MKGETPEVGNEVHDTVERTWKTHGILSAEKKKGSHS